MTDDEIKAVAIGICTALGLDPHETVQAAPDEMETPQERYQRGNTTYDMSWTVERWRRYRWQAAMAIAADIAINAATLDNHTSSGKTRL